MKEEAQSVIEKLRQLGSNLTFEGEYVADFIERLDKLVEVVGVKMDGNVLKILIGDIKAADATEILSVVAKATLLNVTAAGYDDTPYGKMIYFEYYIPPWNAIYV